MFVSTFFKKSALTEGRKCPSGEVKKRHFAILYAQCSVTQITYYFNCSSLSILSCVVGCVLKSPLKLIFLPVKGLMMNICAV